MCDNDRHGESWEKFLVQFKLTGIRDISNGWEVTSASGKTYTVELRTRLDAMGSMYFEWDCDCPANKRCRHIDAVEQMLDAEDHDAEIRERRVLD